jgi:hypothetical protein
MCDIIIRDDGSVDYGAMTCCSCGESIVLGPQGSTVHQCAATEDVR